MFSWHWLSTSAQGAYSNEHHYMIMSGLTQQRWLNILPSTKFTASCKCTSCSSGMIVSKLNFRSRKQATRSHAKSNMQAKVITPASTFKSWLGEAAHDAHISEFAHHDQTSWRVQATVQYDTCQLPDVSIAKLFFCLEEAGGKRYGCKNLKQKYMYPHQTGCTFTRV